MENSHVVYLSLCWNEIVHKHLDEHASVRILFKHKGILWGWTFVIDTFNNEISDHQAIFIPDSDKPYYYNNKRCAAALD